ncbi:MAG: hypothetical protein HXX13_09335 [Bacteroidetes bacterium]|nr:hypothetical protein [Bacteroidota bacterium]
MIKLKLLFAVAGIYLLCEIHAQETYDFIGGGYTYSQFTKLSRLNSIVDVFNQNNPWMTNKMRHPGSMMNKILRSAYQIAD